MKAQLTNQKTKVDSLERDLNVSEAWVGSTVQALSESIELQQRILEILEAKVQESQTRQRDMSGKIRTLSKDVSEQFGELGILTGRLEGRDPEFERLQAETAQIQRKLEDMEVSTSWKFTQSLRKLSATLRRNRQRDRTTRSYISIVQQSELFDAGWYTRIYPEVANFRLTPVEHYVLRGAQKSKDPGPTFSHSCYLEAYPDVASTKLLSFDAITSPWESRRMKEASK